MYQTDGIEMPRCGSLASRAPPVVEIDGATTQLFEPIPWSEASPSAASRPAIRSAACPSAATERQATAWASSRGPAIGGGAEAAMADGLAAGTGSTCAVTDAPAPPEPGRPVGVITGASWR